MADDEKTPPAPRPHFGLLFRPEFNAGHVLTAGTLVVGLVVWGTRLESRVDQEAELRRRVEIRVDAVEKRAQDSFQELKTEIRRANDKLDRLIEGALRNQPPWPPKP